MPKACFPWPSGAAIPPSTGCRRRSAASFRWTVSMCRGGWRAPSVTSKTFPRRVRASRGNVFEVTADRCFRQVMEACAAPAPGRTESWINDEILRLYTALHASGHAHSVECWQDGALAGGLYGVRLGAAFFGESMFSRRRDASKVALVHLVNGLKRGGFTLLDTQFITAHLARFGAIEIPRERYLLKLQDALNREALWPFF